SNEETDMNARQIELVQSSWEQVLPIADVAGGLLYTRLFEINPDARKLFDGASIAAQGRKLMSVVGQAINNLHRIHTMLPALRYLGPRHALYGVLDEHYDQGGEALLWTLETGLGEAFDMETRNAWAAAYALIVGAMKEGAGVVQKAAERRPGWIYAAARMKRAPRCGALFSNENWIPAFAGMTRP